MTLFTAKMTEELYATAIGAAVAHLRAFAMDDAEDRARKTAASYYARLNDFGWDIKVAFPNPDSFRDQHYEYLLKQARRNTASSLTSAQPAQKRTYTMKAPDLRIKDDAKLERYVAEARDFAAAQYDAFVAKLVNKIGDHASATLEGNHIWGESFLTVTFAGERAKETWKTQQIWNVSKLGKDFPQWPSRKLKVAR